MTIVDVDDRRETAPRAGDASSPESGRPGPRERDPGAHRSTGRTPGSRTAASRALAAWPVWLMLALTAGAYLWNLSSNGWGNGFYAAAAQAGSKSWTAFLFGSSDIANSITVDKTPAFLWPMDISVKLFGLNSWSLMVPEVLMGVASVGLVYASVARAVGRRAGLLAGYALALTPVAALMFRFDNPEAMMLFLMSIAAYATCRAIENGRIRWMVLCGAALGFAFLAKQLQGLIVVPGFGLAWLLLASTTLRRRLYGLGAALAALVVAAGWWIAAVVLTPASARPYIGGSQTNSIWDLTFGYNGLGRITGNETGSVGGGATNSPSLWRMFDTSFGGQISWLMPAAIVLTVAAFVVTRRAARTDLRRATLVVWGSWFLVTWAVFSIMQGIQHQYYSVALAPAIAAILGLSAQIVWDSARAERYFAAQAAADAAAPGALAPGAPVPAAQRVGSVREAMAGGTWQFAVLGFATAMTAVWSFVLLGRAEYLTSLRWGILVLGILAGAALVFGAHLHRQLLGLAVAGALVAGLAGPAAFTYSTLSTGHQGSLVAAGPSSGGMGGAPGGSSGGAPGGGQQSGTSGQGTAQQGTGTGTTQNGAAQGGTAQGTTGQSSTGQGTTGQAGAAPQGQSGTTSGTGQSAGTQASGSSSQSGPGAGGGMGGVGTMLNTSTPSQTLLDYLSKDAGNYTWMLAVVGSNNAAGYQLESGYSVMPVGGYNGTDPAPTLAQFQQLVKEGKIHYYIAGTISSGTGGTSSGSDDANQINTWVKAHYRSTTVDGTVVYDLTSTK